MYEIRDGLFAQTFQSESSLDPMDFINNDGIEIHSMWMEQDQKELNIWRKHPDLGIVVRDFSFETTEDLLALVEATPHMAHERQIQVHIRSLNTGLTHPQAKEAILGGDFIPAWVGCDIKSCGDILAVMFRIPSSWRYLYIWNWKTGEELYKRTNVCGYAYLSPKSFVVMLFQRYPHFTVENEQESANRPEGKLLLQIFEISRIHDSIFLEMLPKFAEEARVNVFSDRISLDSPNMPQDVPFSPFIRDETAERMIVIHYTSYRIFSFIRVRPLLHLLAKQKQLLSSMKRREYSWYEWSSGVAFCITSTEIDLGSTPIYGSRVGLLCRRARLFDEGNLSEAEILQGDSDLWQAPSFGILDFNPRPVLRELSLQKSEEHDKRTKSMETVERFHQRLIFADAKPSSLLAKLRFFEGAAEEDYHDVMLDTNHITLIKDSIGYALQQFML
ncbi:hypothetical protein FRC20_000838 [Serendipita sp. 405]|nr:hypothetical protein FRC20_000838 [Serendipita sp. 405]